MKSVIPFKKEIEFKTKIAEVCSISLEHEYVVNGAELKGDFIVFGEYKVHEVSVNRDAFRYRLPFMIDLSENVDVDSIDFQILDFTYDVVDDDKLEVFIEFSVEAAELPKEDIFIPVEEVDFEEEIQRVVDDEAEEEESEEDLELVDDRIEEIVAPVVEEEIDEERKEVGAEEEILSTDKVDTYVMYHIHIVQESESVESICKMYDTNSATLGEYNDLSNLVVGDKLIIPENVDE